MDMTEIGEESLLAVEALLGSMQELQELVIKISSTSATRTCERLLEHNRLQNT
jgi:hypothetical protein